jgi:hypothetical protein
MKDIFTLPVPTKYNPVNYAVGVIKSKEYKPGKENHNKGKIVTEESKEVGALLIKEARFFYNEREDIDFSKPQFLVVYPRTDKESLELSVLVKNLRGTNIKDSDSGKFYISGYMVFNDPKRNLVAFRINPNKKEDDKAEVKFKPFALQCKAKLPKEGMGKLWKVSAISEDNKLIVVDAECIDTMMEGYEKKSFKPRKRPQKVNNRSTDNNIKTDKAQSSPGKPNNKSNDMKVLRRPLS